MKRRRRIRRIERYKPKGLPPYVSYSTFIRFLESLRQGVPSRIDRSVLGWVGPAARAQLLLAIRFLGLTEETGNTKERLEDIASATGPLRQKLLRETIERAYRGVLADLNLEHASSDQLQEQFKRTGASGVTLRKCTAFFRAAIEDAGIPHSQYAGKRKPGRPTGSKSTKAPVGSKAGHGGLDPRPTPFQNHDAALELMAGKLPAFDPSWNNETKQAWFETFRRLLDLQSSAKSRL